MTKNTGKPSEETFDAAILAIDAKAFVYSITDASDLYGRNGRVVATDNNPSDRIVTLRGRTFYAEIKSTHDKQRFGYNLIKKTQLGYARQVLRAGGEYFFFVHSLHYNRWYQISAEKIINDILNSKKKSSRWEELEKYQITLESIN